ncbi:MAG: hypothetical protein KDB84_11440, partial [Flavobacteriales bacterium]|nr:hypothetical protein [Flavobacteriales bacterium]
MKLRYITLSALALALSGSITAQLATPRAAKMEFGTAAEQANPRLPMEADGQRGGGPIFSEDFANGLAGN